MCSPRAQLFDCQLSSSLYSTAHTALPYETLEPWAAHNMPTNVGTCSATTAALNVDIESLAAAMKSLEDDPLNAAFGAVVSILGLVHSFFFFFPHEAMWLCFMTGL